MENPQKTWLPSGKLTWQWKVPFFSRETHLQMLHFPIAMLVYWSVSCWLLVEPPILKNMLASQN